MLSNLKQFVKDHQNDIILLLGVILISLLSFAMGYIFAKQQAKEQIKFEYNSNPQKNNPNIIRIASECPEYRICRFEFYS